MDQKELGTENKLGDEGQYGRIGAKSEIGELGKQKNIDLHHHRDLSHLQSVAESSTEAALYSEVYGDLVSFHGRVVRIFPLPAWLNVAELSKFIWGGSLESIGIWKFEPTQQLVGFIVFVSRTAAQNFVQHSKQVGGLKIVSHNSVVNVADVEFYEDAPPENQQDKVKFKNWAFDSNMSATRVVELENINSGDTFATSYLISEILRERFPELNRWSEGTVHVSLMPGGSSGKCRARIVFKSIKFAVAIMQFICGANDDVFHGIRMTFGIDECSRQFPPSHSADFTIADVNAIPSSGNFKAVHSATNVGQIEESKKTSLVPTVPAPIAPAPAVPAPDVPAPAASASPAPAAAAPVPSAPAAAAPVPSAPAPSLPTIPAPAPSAPAPVPQQTVLIRGFPQFDAPTLKHLSTLLFGGPIERIKLTQDGYYVSFVHAHAAKFFLNVRKRLVLEGRSGRLHRTWVEWASPEHNQVDRESVVAAIHPDILARRVLFIDGFTDNPKERQEVGEMKVAKMLRDLDEDSDDFIQSIKVREAKAKVVFTSLKFARMMKEKLAAAGLAKMTVAFTRDECEREKLPKKYNAKGYEGVGALWVE
ncbi:hypothetical protein RUND412_011616 [Rhizina undulata]